MAFMKKKILFIIWSFTYGGGAEKILANIVNNMDLEKYDIDILEYWHADINEEKVKKEINILPPVIDSTRDSHIKMHYYKYLLEHNPEKLRKKYIKKEYDYEISFNILIPSFLLSKSAKTISWNHGSIEDLKNRKKDLRLQKNVFENVNKIVAISEKTYNSIIDIFPEYADKTVIINNGFDFSDVLNKSKSKSGEHKNSNKFKFVFAGRFDKNKNPLFLIEIAKKLKQDNIDFQLLMLGKGELQEKVIKKINEYDLNDYVQLLGYKKNPYTYYKEADAILLCSYSEGFPTVLAEGLILGKPFVSTNVGGVIELSDNNTCGFVADNLDEYYKYCKELICNKNLYNKMSISAKKNIQKFTIEKQVHRLENLINKIDRGGGNKI